MSVFAGNRRLWSILLISFTALAVGCWWLFRDQPWHYFGLDGISFWTVTSYEGKPAEKGLILMFDGYQIALDGACAQQRWRYDRDDDEIEIGKPSGATLRCVVKPTPPEIDLFMARRERLTKLSIDGDHLALFDDDGTLVLDAERLPPKGLENRTWSIAAFQFGDKLTDTHAVFRDPERVHLTFIQGTFHGYAGCQYVFGMYRQVPEWLIDPDLSPIHNCGKMEQQAADAIRAALSAGYFIEQTADRIILTGEDGRIQVVLTPRRVIPEP